MNQKSEEIMHFAVDEVSLVAAYSLSLPFDEIGKS